MPWCYLRNFSPQSSRRNDRRDQRRILVRSVMAVTLCLGAPGCSALYHQRQLDRQAGEIIAEKQIAALGRVERFEVESAADTLRYRLLAGQNLPVAGAASFGVGQLDPIRHGRPVIQREGDVIVGAESDSAVPLSLTLAEALQVAAANSRDFQNEKEDVFRTALDLELERDRFRTSLSGLFSAAFSSDSSERNQPGGAVEESERASAEGAAGLSLPQGTDLSVRLGWDMLKLLRPDEFLTRGVFGDASIAIPLLRGSGRSIAAEARTQAERDTLYAIYGFEQFKSTFAVRVASNYLAVLQRSDEVRNVEENYRGLIAATRRARRLLDAGDLPPIQVDQAIQDELRARNRWISAREDQTSALDDFLVLLGLPPDAVVELDRAEFERLGEVTDRFSVELEAFQTAGEIPPADAPIVLVEPSQEDAGDLELDVDEAVRTGLARRLDLRARLGQVEDAQRRVVIAADGLRPGLTLQGGARVDADRPANARLDEGVFDAQLTLDLPFETTADAIAHRTSVLRLESAVRDVQELEDDIKLSVRGGLRDLREARESVQIQALAVELARRRVRGADLNLQAGRAEIRDLLEAQEDLLSAQNALTAAAVNYRIAELELQRDLGTLQVGPEGLWEERETEDQ